MEIAANNENRDGNEMEDALLTVGVKAGHPEAIDDPIGSDEQAAESSKPTKIIGQSSVEETPQSTMAEEAQTNIEDVSVETSGLDEVEEKSAEHKESANGAAESANDAAESTSDAAESAKYATEDVISDAAEAATTNITPGVPQEDELGSGEKAAFNRLMSYNDESREKQIERIVGSMTGGDEDDSDSESEEEADASPAREAPSTSSTIGGGFARTHTLGPAPDDSDEEEIELGPGAVVSKPKASKPVRSKHDDDPFNMKEDNKLAALMGQSVEDTETQDGNDVPQDDFLPSYAQQGRKKKNQPYKLPSGPAFADEKEFEKDLKSSELQKDLAYSAKNTADDESDDEFGFDGEGEAGGAAGDAGATVEMLAAARKRQEAQAAQEEENIKAAIRREAELRSQREGIEGATAPMNAPKLGVLGATLSLHELGRAPHAGSTLAAEAGAAGAAGGSAVTVAATAAAAAAAAAGDAAGDTWSMEQAKEAAKDMHEIYSSGLGDSEAEHGLVLEKSNTQNGATPPQPPPSMSSLLNAPLGGICEEDEEAFEEEEAAVEAAEEQEKREKEEQEAALAAEWNAVEQLREEQAKIAPEDAKGVKGVNQRKAFAAISYKEALRHFRTAEYCTAHAEGTFDIKFKDVVERGVPRSRLRLVESSGAGGGASTGSVAGAENAVNGDFGAGEALQAQRRGSDAWEAATVERMRKIEPHAPRKAGLFACFSGPPRLNFPSGVPDRDLMFCVAKCCFDDEEPVHLRILQTVNKKLLAFDMKSKDVPRFGNHWEDIGFQGKDPATDLRGVGMLVLVQMLGFVNEHHALTVDIQRYSDNGRKYPVMALSTNFTEICLRVLREGRLHAEINKKKNVATVINELFYALWFHFYERVRAEPAKWIKHKNDTKAEGVRLPLPLLQRFREAMSKKTYEGQASFTDIGDKNLTKTGAGCAGAGAGTGAAKHSGGRYAAT